MINFDSVAGPNEKVWESHDVPPHTSISQAMQYLHEWYTVSNSRVSASTWTKPRSGFFKLNVDASIFQPQNSFGAGLVLRDSCGCFIQAKPREAEAMHDTSFCNAMVTKHEFTEHNHPSSLSSRCGWVGITEVHSQPTNFSIFLHGHLDFIHTSILNEMQFSI